MQSTHLIQGKSSIKLFKEVIHKIIQILTMMIKWKENHHTKKS